jgi:hypothetical protein
MFKNSRIKQLRLKSIELALRTGVEPEGIIDLAKKIFNYIQKG